MVKTAFPGKVTALAQIYLILPQWGSSVETLGDIPKNSLLFI
jgi:hypothetical protein